MNPVRIADPVGTVVDLDEMKRRLHIDFEDDDDQLADLEKQAVSWLDGWRGVLGRCILEQQWSVEYRCGTMLRLPFPDVSAIDVEIDGVAVTAKLYHDALGSFITLDNPDAKPVSVTLTAALPEDALPTVKAAIILWVQKNYFSYSGTEAENADRAIKALIAPLRCKTV